MYYIYTYLYTYVYIYINYTHACSWKCGQNMENMNIGESGWIKLVNIHSMEYNTNAKKIITKE